MFRTTLIALTLLAMAGPARAAEKGLATPATLETPTTVMMPASTNRLDVPRRPAALPALYVTFAALQITDVRTTFGAVARGAHETNPMLGRGNQATVWAVKAATTASTVYFAERLWKQNRVAAILVMAGINGGYAAIAAHNAKQAR
jgi:hypothetical protein